MIDEINKKYGRNLFKIYKNYQLFEEVLMKYIFPLMNGQQKRFYSVRLIITESTQTVQLLASLNPSKSHTSSPLLSGRLQQFSFSPHNLALKMNYTETSGK
jgi:hypothetical protein